MNQFEHVISFVGDFDRSIGLNSFGIVVGKFMVRPYMIGEGEYKLIMGGSK